jgi:LacI family transcriptional regulator
LPKNYRINKISEALHLSRNTVSKVINKKPGVSEKTRRLVFDYIDAHSVDSEGNGDQGRIIQNKIIMFSYRVENIEYINGLLSGIESSLKENGYSMVLNIVRDLDDSPASLPPSLYDGSVCGIISFNIYDVQYWQEIISLKIPSVFFDMLPNYHLFKDKTDIIAPENEVAIYEMIKILKDRGHQRFGFIGNPDYCFSLYQRWQTFKRALQSFSIPLNMEQCVFDDHFIEDIQRLQERLTEMPAIPDAFICASDRQALLLISALHNMSLAIPEDVAVVGFDNLPSTTRSVPPLTTVEAHLEYQGKMAVRKILDRLENPERPYEFTQYETTLILRESTGHSSH